MRRAARTVIATCAVAAATCALAACGAGSSRPSTTARRQAPVPTTQPSTATTTAAPKPQPKPKPKPKPPPPPAYPQLLSAALTTAPTGGLVPAVRWDGQTVAWIERTSAVAVMAFDQRLLELHLHSGTIDAGTLGWRYGPTIAASEAGRMVAAFNGGFRLSVGVGGFVSYGRVAAPLQDGLGSIVTYADGSTDIGSWQREVPSAGKRVVAIRQNLSLLVDHGVAASNLDCLSCWGATLGGVSAPARSALGIAADGRLIWVGGESLTVAELADTLLAAHVVRAVELDINPEWVAGYLYGHRGGKGPLAPLPALPSQHGIPGQYLAPWSRDFFTIVAR